MNTEANSISEVTRRGIFDGVRVGGVPIYGRLEELEFLQRVFDLGAMPSTDRRFHSMKSDIHQHTINNNDWPDDWIFTDSRIDLWGCADELFLRFIAEMVHPIVRPIVSEAKALLGLFNDHLRVDGWELAEARQISGKPVFEARRLSVVKRSESSAVAGAAETNSIAETKSLPTAAAEPSFDPSKEVWHAPAPPEFEGVAVEALGPLSSADVVIMTATKVELAQVLRLLRPPRGKPKVVRVYSGPETYYLGVFGKFRAVVTLCAMGTSGPISSEQTARSALERWKPAALIMSGIAWGSSRAKQGPADVLVASQILPYDVERVGAQVVFRGPIPPSGPTLLNRFRGALTWTFRRPNGTQVLAHCGKILSGEKLVDDPKLRDALLEKYPDAIGGEMEGAGIFASAFRERTEWILVKGVCDWADGRKHDEYQEMAAAASASLVEHVLSDSEALNGLAASSPAPVRESRPTKTEVLEEILGEQVPAIRDIMNYAAGGAIAANVQEEMRRIHVRLERLRIRFHEEPDIETAITAVGNLGGSAVSGQVVVTQEYFTKLAGAEQLLRQRLRLSEQEDRGAAGSASLWTPRPVSAPEMRLFLQGGQFWRYMKDTTDWCIGPRMLLWLENGSSIEATGVKFTGEVVQSPSDKSDVGIWPHMGHIWGVCPAVAQPRVSLKAKPEFTLGYEERWQAARVDLILVRNFTKSLKLKFTWGSAGHPHEKLELTATPEGIEAMFRVADQAKPGEKFIAGAEGLRALFSLDHSDPKIIPQDYEP